MAVRFFQPLLLLFALPLVSGVAADVPASTEQADYVLLPSDLLKVQVFQELDLLREVRISQEYTVVLPLIGRVDLRNKTLRQAEALIRELYDRDFLVNPQVNVMVLEYARRSVNVLGSVNNPGSVLFPQEQRLSLLDAIARAGGFNRLADRKHVKLTRSSLDGKMESSVINVDQLIQGNSGQSYSLSVNDVIYVPERVL